MLAIRFAKSALNALLKLPSGIARGRRRELGCDMDDLHA
jgi:hypothetical protein